MSSPLDSVLIIEDSPLQALYAADLCTRLGAREVRLAHDGEQGLALLSLQPPSLLLLDLEMPKVDGVQFLQRMAGDKQQVPIIVTSGKDYLLISSVELMARELGLHVLGGLKKPLQEHEMADLLSRLTLTPLRSADDEALCSDVDVRLALDAAQIVPYYQPKVTLRGNVLKGAEMLARWIHPEQGVIPPSRFIPVIEAQDWATELTLKMLEHGLAQWQQWARHGLRLPLSVNLSARSLRGNTLVAEIEHRIRNSRIPPRYIIFEITETTVAENLAEALGIAARLRLAGVGLSIDDFGTGFATVQQLMRFPFTELKIDQSLVTSVSRKPHLEAILNGVLELSERLQLSTVAEGIETQDDSQCMDKHGCLLGQGYYYARPLPPPQFENWVKERMVMREVS